MLGQSPGHPVPCRSPLHAPSRLHSLRSRARSNDAVCALFREGVAQRHTMLLLTDTTTEGAMATRPWSSAQQPALPGRHRPGPVPEVDVSPVPVAVRSCFVCPSTMCGVNTVTIRYGSALLVGNNARAAAEVGDESQHRRPDW